MVALQNPSPANLPDADVGFKHQSVGFGLGRFESTRLPVRSSFPLVDFSGDMLGFAPSLAFGHRPGKAVGRTSLMQDLQ